MQCGVLNCTVIRYNALTARSSHSVVTASHSIAQCRVEQRNAVVSRAEQHIGKRERERESRP